VRVGSGFSQMGRWSIQIRFAGGRLKEWALGLTSDDPLSAVDEDPLLSRYRYLAAHLTFPFEAKWEPESGPTPTIKITGLSDPKGEPGIEEMYGLFCEARAD
jgi:hypothetical protein